MTTRNAKRTPEGALEAMPIGRDTRVGKWAVTKLDANRFLVGTDGAMGIVTLADAALMIFARRGDRTATGPGLSPYGDMIYSEHINPPVLAAEERRDRRTKARPTMPR
jgi:hypothetical protein